MTLPHRSQIRVVTVVAIAAIIVVASLWLRIPNSVSTFGRVMATREWTLTTGNDGQVIAILRNNATGVNESYVVSQASAEGRIGLRTNPTVLLAGRVEFGDTVGLVQSSETREQLISLKRQLDLARANLRAETVGQKPATIAVAQLEEERASVAVAERKKTVDRLRTLRARNMISQEEYETQEGELTLLDLDRRLAAARLEEAQCGAREETLDLIRAEIRGLEAEILAVEDRIDAFTIVAPLSGTITRSLGQDTVMVIHEDSDRLAVLALRLPDSHEVAQSNTVSLIWRSNGLTGSAKLQRIEPFVKVIAGEQVVFATVLLESISETPPPGTVIQCDLNLGELSLLQGAQKILISTGVL